MKLSQLLEKADVENAYADVEISFVTDKPEKCVEGCAFVCISGRNHDGHDFIPQAEKNGAAVFITEKNIGRENQIIVNNTRKAYAYMCSRFFSQPSKELKLIGITGTNGKTTVANMIYSLLTAMGEKTGLIGTVENIIDGKKQESSLTTPDAFELNFALRQMVSCGTKYCVCEVSSQALDQYRTYGCEFSVGVFTNITQDHLDYHGSFENYLSSKQRLFTRCKSAVINADDKYADSFISAANADVITYSSRKDEADITAKNIKYGDGVTCFAAVMFSAIAAVKTAGIGEYSVRNSLAAIGAMIKLGFDFETICKNFEKVKAVRGRGEKLDIPTEYSVIIDYAHTPDALYNVLYALSFGKKGRLIVLFGCGGDRDKSKRADMGNVVSSFADIAIVTSDNPRSESEDEIISDILSGVNNRKCRIYVEKNRSEAIRLALSKAKSGDTVLLAGKGHEAYQVINGRKIYFDEREKVAEFLR